MSRILHEQVYGGSRHLFTEDKVYSFSGTEPLKLRSETYYAIEGPDTHFIGNEYGSWINCYYWGLRL
jgi:hypothetical protein